MLLGAAHRADILLLLLILGKSRAEVVQAGVRKGDAAVREAAVLRVHLHEPEMARDSSLKERNLSPGAPRNGSRRSSPPRDIYVFSYNYILSS